MAPFADIKSPVRLGTFDSTGPDVTIRVPPIIAARIDASVVLPVPAGPLSRTCGTLTLRARAPSTTMRTRAMTSCCPIISSRDVGRSSLRGSIGALGIATGSGAEA